MPSACRRLDPLRLILGEAPTAEKAGEDPLPDQPYSVELGNVATGAGCFVLGALRTGPEQSRALLVAVDAGRGVGSIRELGTVRGDAEPPVAAAFGSRALALAADSADPESMLRVFGIDAPCAEGKLARAELGLVRPETGLGLALGSESGVAAFARAGSAGLSLQDLDPKTLKARSAPHEVPVEKGVRAESPRLLVRPGGFYLAFIARSEIDPPQGARPKEEEELEGPLLEQGPSVVRVLSLDARGVPQGSPIGVTEPEARVMVFDAMPTPEGGLLVAYHDERQGLRIDRQSLELTWVRADGSHDHRVLELEESVGLPSLLRDPEASGKSPWGMLSVPADVDSRLLALARGPLDSSDEPSEKNLPGGFEALGALGGKLLGARSRGAGTELGLFDCGVAPAARR